MRQQNTQKKNNRKSILVIGLLLMLVAVIGFGGYTLSKYVTKKSTDASANVAKWGFTATADASNLFGKDYAYDTTKTSSVVNDGTGTLTVSANTANRTNRVAPGTTGSMTFTVTGTAEVKAQIKIEMKNMKDITLDYTNDGAAGTQYAPVKWTLKKNNAPVPNAENVTLAVLATKLNSTETYNANTAKVEDTYTIEWTWAFSTSAENDILDTLLGMSANETTNATIEKYVTTAVNTVVGFDLEISITQLAQ